jgi:hypothetical protein
MHVEILVMSAYFSEKLRNGAGFNVARETSARGEIHKP